MKKRSLRAWLPVLGLVGVLFALPSGPPATAGANGPLKISPNQRYYAGQQITFKGDVGNGVQTIRMQRRQSPTSGWDAVYDPETGKEWKGRTKANGTFKFTFPAFAMNTLQIRVVGRTGKTKPVTFYSTFQEVELDWSLAGDNELYPLPAGTAAVGEDVEFEAWTRSVTIDKGRPAPLLVGRGIAVQFQNSELLWETPSETFGQTDTKGRYAVRFDFDSPGTHVVRPSLDNWTKGGDQIGWFPGFPQRIEVVQRPSSISALSTFAPVGFKAIDLSWALPNELPDAIIIHRYHTTGGDLDTSEKIAELAGTDTSFHDDDDDLVAGESYTYAVFTRDADGIYSRLPVEASAVPNDHTPPPPPPVTP